MQLVNHLTPDEIEELKACIRFAIAILEARKHLDPSIDKQIARLDRLYLRIEQIV